MEHRYDGGPSQAELLRVMTAVRVRPFSTAEISGQQLKSTSTTPKVIVHIPEPQRPEEGSIVCVDPLFYSTPERSLQERKFFERKFNFDLSFSGGATGDTPNQELVFKKLGEPLIQHLLAGYNCSILAYGQTGSGKTFTMIGEDNSPEYAGIIPRLCRGLLQEIAQRLAAPITSTSSSDASSSSFSLASLPSRLQTARVSCSFYEIYCEKVYDLLASVSEDSAQAQGQTGGASRVREHPDDGAYVENLTYSPIRTYEDAAALMVAGLRQRAVAETRMNAASSRSHAVFTIVVKQTLCAAGGEAMERASKIVLVDLAGSERASLTGATGERLIEANNINKSLSTLGDVIKALSEGGGGGRSEVSGPSQPTSSSHHSGRTLFVPYRNSILTFLLKDSLGGSSRTVMLATCSPSEASFNETISTLRYVERAKYIAAAPVVHESSTDPAFVALLQKQIVVLQEKLLVANRSRQARDQELRAEFARQETETLREHQRQVSGLQEQLKHLHSRSQPASPMSPGMTPIKSLQSSSAPTGSQSPLNTTLEQMELDPPVDAAVMQLLGESAADDAGKALLLLEVHRLSAALEDREKQLAASAGAGAVMSGSMPPNNKSLGAVDLERDKLRKLAHAYKEDKTKLAGQYAAVVIQLKSVSDELAAERSRVEVLESRVAQFQNECSEKNVQCRRMESDIAAKEEEMQTVRIEAEFLNAKHTSAGAKHKQELMLLQARVNKAKDAEEAARREKEADVDRYTDLMVDAQRRNEADREVWERQLQVLRAQNTQLGADVALLNKDKERFREALNAKFCEAAELEAQMAALREQSAQALLVAHDEARQVQERMQKAFDSSQASLTVEISRAANFEAELAARTQELAIERQALMRAEVKLSVIQDDVAAKEGERRRLATGEESLKAALDAEAKRLKDALDNVTSTRSELDEKAKAHQDLIARVVELDLALQAEKAARQEAEKRTSDLSAELSKRKKKLTAAIEALEENKSRLATLAQIEVKLKAAEARAESAASQAIESDTRNAKKDQKVLDLQAAAAKQQAKITELSAALREVQAQSRRSQEAAADVSSKHKAEMKSIKLEHALLLDEVISLREQLETQAVEHQEAQATTREQHAAEIESLDRRRADQYLAQQQALAAAEERANADATMLEELRGGYDAIRTKVKAERDNRRKEAVADVTLRLDNLLLGTDEFDEQYVAVQRVLSMIDLNMEQLDAEVRSAAMLDRTSSPDKSAEATGVGGGMGGATSIVVAPFDSDAIVVGGEAPNLSPRMVQAFEGILDRQRKLFGSVRGLKGAIQELSLSSFGESPVSTSDAAFSSPTRPGAGSAGHNVPQAPPSPTSPTHLVEHDQQSMSQEIIRSKLALAVAASENEDLRVAYRRMERVACDLKLKVATLASEIEDKNEIIAGMMDRLTALQKAQASSAGRKDEGFLGLNLSVRGFTSTGSSKT